MARIRSVHPTLFTDEAWVSCSAFARLLYIGLWTDADDQGLFPWKPLTLKMKIFPADGVDVAALLGELVEAKLIGRFEHTGAAFGAIKDFRKFQRPKKPNAIHHLPLEWREYVALDGSGSELADDDEAEVPHRFPTGSENRPQMEDGGGRKEEIQVVAVERVTEVDDWPDHDAALLLAATVASPRLDPQKTSGLITTAGRLTAWRRAGASWQHDVIPVVTALTRKTGPPISTWKYFDAAIGQSVSDNRQALSIPAAQRSRNAPAANDSRQADNLERAFRGADLAAAFVAERR